MYESIIKDKASDSYASYNFFKKNYEKFKPLKKLTVFFDSENFLTTPYAVEGSFVHMVIENWKGQEIHINNMNCGYGGTGPSETARLLKHLGMNEENAEYLKHKDGLQIGFTQDGKIDFNDIKTDVFFGGSVRQEMYKFDINENCFIHLSEKKIYMLNPHLTNFKGMLNAIDIMKPREIEYYIGSNSPLENSFRFKDDFKIFKGNNAKYNYMKIKGANQVNLIIRGEIFDVICLVKNSDLMMVINIIYLYLFKENLFINKVFANYSTVTLIKDYNIWSILKYYFEMIFKKKETSIHEVIKIELNNGEMKKCKLYL